MSTSTTEQSTEPPPRVRFVDMPLSDEAKTSLAAMGYELATPVQSEVFEKAMEGGDLMVQSKTGTGKTTAFGLPLIERIKMGQAGEVRPQALVMCPTRELAVQVGEELAELGDAKGVRILPIYGGASMGAQLSGLKSGVDVVVGTPGRILDHIRRRTLRLDFAHTAVLDEADEMLSMGFWDDVMDILKELPPERQTLLFSATLPDAIRKMAKSEMKDPELIDISRDELTVEHIINYSYESDERLPKPRNLLYILEVERPETAIIFCNTRDDCTIVAAFLRRQGLHALSLSGELAQRDRERVMGRMKRGDLKYLVATDIAARGIDISDLSHVVNYSLPNFTEVFLHRVGRTGRIGKKGTAVSLVSGRDEMTYTELQRQFGIEFIRKELPDFTEIRKMQAERVADDLYKEARDTEITSFVQLAEQLKETKQGTTVIAYLLKGYFARLEEERAHEPGQPKPAPREREEAPRERAPKRRDDRRDDRGSDRASSRDDGPRERRPRRDAEERPRRPEPDEGTYRLFISRGSNDGYDESMVRRLVIEAAKSGAPEDLGRVLLRRTHSFIDAKTEVAQAAIKASEDGLERDDKPVGIERARSRG